jgi:hypothetical protein
MAYDKWRDAMLADVAFTLKRLAVIDYVPPLGGEGKGMPMEVVELEGRVRLVLANGKAFELTEAAS